MRPRFSLAARTFLFSFVPICFVLAGTFWALSAAIHQEVKREVRQSLQASDLLLNRASAEYIRRTTQLLPQLTDSAGLEAAVGLIAEVHDGSAMAEVRRTIETQLRDLQASSDYDLLAVTKVNGQTIAGIALSQDVNLQFPPVLPLTSGLQEVGQRIYQWQAVPIVIDGEPQAMLTLGSRFDLTQLPLAGHAVLLKKGKVFLSTFPQQRNSEVENEINRRCPAFANGCEISLMGDTFVVSQLERGQFGEGYLLLGFCSLSEPLKRFQSSLIQIFVQLGGTGMIATLFCALIASHSVSRPVRELVAQLNRGEESGQMPKRLHVTRPVSELTSLVEAFNRVSEAEHQSRRELEEAKNAAESANRLKTEFLTNVSHELLTPVNGVLGMTDLLFTTSLNGEQEEYAVTVRQSAQALVGVIGNILNFSNLEARTFSLFQEPFDLCQLIAQVTEQLRTQAAGKPLKIEGICSGGTSQMVIGDSSRIRQILLHLGSNAIKFTPKGRIQIHLHRILSDEKSGTFRFSVEDTGIGIAPELLNFVFDRFTQADGSLTRRHGGLGLGLAIAKELVQLMGGEIGVESRLHAGSTFWFTLKLDLLPESPHDVQNHRTAVGESVPC